MPIYIGQHQFPCMYSMSYFHGSKDHASVKAFVYSSIIQRLFFFVKHLGLSQHRQQFPCLLPLLTLLVFLCTFL